MPGEGLSQAYDEAICYRCCEPATFGARSSRELVWLRARHDGTWYDVETGVHV